MVNCTDISRFDGVAILKRRTDQPDHEVNLKVLSCPSSPRSRMLFSVSMDSTSSSQHRNTRRHLESSPTYRSRLRGLASTRTTSDKPFFAHDWVKPTLDDGVFLLDTTALAERIHSLSDDSLILFMNSYHNLVAACFGLDRLAISTIHSVLDTGAGPNFLRSDVLPSTDVPI